MTTPACRYFRTRRFSMFYWRLGPTSMAYIHERGTDRLLGRAYGDDKITRLALIQQALIQATETIVNDALPVLRTC